MSIVTRVLALLRRTPATSDDLEAEREAARLRDRLETTRVASGWTDGSAGESYESQTRRR